MEIYSNFRYRNTPNYLHKNSETIDIKRVVAKRKKLKRLYP